MIFERQPGLGWRPPCISRFFGEAPLRAITNSGTRQWVSDLLTSGLSAATSRKAVFALRQYMAAAIADNRLQFNPATAIPLSTERQKPAHYLSQLEVERLVDEMPRQYRALVLVGAYGDLDGRGGRTTETRH
jgi:site-specific recombinase XerD